jgi:hypothetical protein
MSLQIVFSSSSDNFPDDVTVSKTRIHHLCDIYEKEENLNLILEKHEKQTKNNKPGKR